jgi:hypothetical protein
MQLMEVLGLNQSERLMLSNVLEHCNVVPGLKNQMNIGAATCQRYDLMEQAKLTNDCLNNLIMFSAAEDDKGYWREEFNDSLKALKNFTSIRGSENWEQNTSYSYTTRLGGW